MCEADVKADFRLFLVLWNQRQNFKTPILHLKMAAWLETAWEAGDTRLLLMAFRSAGKSSIVGVFAAWLIYQNNDIRILVLAADSTLAGKMVRNVKRIIERHPLCKGLKPKNADQWASDRFTVMRDTELPYVLLAGGTQLYVGTPHTYFSIYADVERAEIGEERAFLDGFKRLILPLITDQGESAWPERYGMEDIARYKIEAGPNKFESQMLLRPVNIMEGRLDVEDLQYYSGEIEYCMHTNRLFIGAHQMVAATCWWDPSLAKNNGDSSVLAVVFGDMGGNYYLHHVEYISVPAGSDEQNNADAQCKIVAELTKRYRLPMIVIEDNGLGKFLPGILRGHFKSSKVMTAVQSVTNRKAKAQRIIEGFDALLAAKRLYVHERVKSTPFIMEMREWRPDSARAKDDGLDAAAGAISLHPDRIAHSYPQGMHNWMKNAAMHRVKDGRFDL